MKRIFTHLFVAVLLMLSTTSWAQVSIVAGKVYNFKNVEYGKSMTAVGLEKTAIDDTDLGDYTQLWYVGEGSVTGTYTLRNLGNGLYLQGAGSGTKWPFVEQPSNLYYQTAGSGFSLTANSGKMLAVNIGCIMVPVTVALSVGMQMPGRASGLLRRLL